MDTLRNEVANYFGREGQPSVNGLVITDGFDELEKERAIAFYAGKSWTDVLHHLHGLKNEPVFGATYYLEEWSVLSKESLRYYLRAHLEFLFENLYCNNPDEEFIASFVFQLYQVIYMHKGSPFSPEQTLFLKKVATVIAENAKDQKRFEYAGNDIIENVKQFLAELDVHGIEKED